MAEISDGENESDPQLLEWAPLKASDIATLTEAFPLDLGKGQPFNKQQSRERG